MTHLDPELRQALPKMRAAGAAVWPILTCYILHANIRNRAWPNLDTLQRETGYARETIIDGKQWLVEHGALVKVGYQLRVERERLHPRQDVMQLTGLIVLDGKALKYLTVAPDETVEVNRQPSRLLTEIPDVTNLSQSSAQQTINRQPSRPEVTTTTTLPKPPEKPTVAMLFMQNINSDLGSLQVETLLDDEQTFGYDIMKAAIQEAANSKPAIDRKELTVNYVRRIARRMFEEKTNPGRGQGADNGKQGLPAHASSPHPPHVIPEPSPSVADSPNAVAILEAARQQIEKKKREAAAAKKRASV